MSTHETTLRETWSLFSLEEGNVIVYTTKIITIIIAQFA